MKSLGTQRPRRVVSAIMVGVATVLVACAGEPSEPISVRPPNSAASVASVPRQTASQRWVALTREIIGRRENGPLGTARTYALLAVAQYNAVIAARTSKARGIHPSEARAAGTAGAAFLASLYPAEQGVIAAQTAADAAYFADMPSERDADAEAGIALGKEAAARVLARAATDGSTSVWTGTIPTGPGFWRNAPAPAQPIGPRWGLVRPWVLDRGDQFRPPPPPAFGSPAFVSALAEVREYSDNLTPAQLAIAQFWQFGSGPGGPMGYFGALATQLAESQHLTEVQAARMFAVMYMAMMDASIGCWDAKYAYWYVRPFQADTRIATPVGRPNFPSYPSAHSCLSASAAEVLAELFPNEGADLEAKVAEAGIARIYAGLHYQFDVTAGQALGSAVARVAIARGPRGFEPIPLD